MIPYEILKELIIHGVRFSYISYDHKKAMAELNEIINSGICPYPTLDINVLKTNTAYMPVFSVIIPDEIKKNHIVWRAGRVWEVFFNKNRQISGI